MQALRSIAWCATLFCCALASAQQPFGFRSTEVHPDRSVTFRFFDRTASRVDLVLENRVAKLPMRNGGDGIWSVTTPPLTPEIYGYRFAIGGGGRTAHDPQNMQRRYANDLLLVPGTPPGPWEEQGVPKGRAISHAYTTRIVTGLPGNRSSFVVYTPPGYNSKAKPYPVLYLLHCWGDQPDSWNGYGQANIILDNLIASHKAAPMVVVMPLGYGEMSFSKDYGVWNDPAAVERNLKLFERALVGEVMPQVERSYNVRRDAAGRAILGASMGGLESLAVGLNRGDLFAWVGGESSALQNLDFTTLLSSFRADDPHRRTIWMVCGKDDELLDSNRQMAKWLQDKGAGVSLEIPDGTHSYIVWREGLVRFASLIFK
ncbi:MAG: esterase [Acidobacteria bacterium]|nr:esterase [Acidobacteriota bacterium]